MDNQLTSKFALIHSVSEKLQKKLLLHKIVLRREVGKIDLHRPGYSHLMVFGDESCKPGKATPDVINAGQMLYDNAMGLNAVNVALDVAVRACNRVLDPFCGVGSVPIVAAKRGMIARGIDIDSSQIQKAIANAS